MHTGTKMELVVTVQWDHGRIGRLVVELAHEHHKAEDHSNTYQ
jgi:hypothetical protein